MLDSMTDISKTSNSDSGNSDVSILWDLIQNSKHCVVLTGAGISTLSGIPDFRGVGGLYSRKDIDAGKLFDINFFKKDPSYYYKNAREFFYTTAAKPNIVHTCLGNLEKQNYIKAVITQNVDLLHQKGMSQNVYELHGSPLWHDCVSCAAQYDFETTLAIMEKEEIPHCPACAGVLKPRIVFFGEMLPEKALEMAEYHAQKADLMLVLGTSLTVYPAASIPQIAVRNGAKIAIVNASATDLDSYAVWHAKDLGSVFEALHKLS